MAKVVKMRRGAMIVYRFQCYVGQSLACEGELRGYRAADFLTRARRGEAVPCEGRPGIFSAADNRPAASISLR